MNSINFGVMASIIGTSWRWVVFITKQKDVMIKELIFSLPRHDGFKGDGTYIRKCEKAGAIYCDLVLLLPMSAFGNLGYSVY
jgi:hypothetical protein